MNGAVDVLVDALRRRVESDLQRHPSRLGGGLGGDAAMRERGDEALLAAGQDVSGLVAQREHDGRARRRARDHAHTFARLDRELERGGPGRRSRDHAAKVGAALREPLLGQPRQRAPDLILEAVGGRVDGRARMSGDEPTDAQAGEREQRGEEEPRAHDPRVAEAVGYEQGQRREQPPARDGNERA